MRKNNTFCGSEPVWANACVGNNGNPSYVEYSKGFSQAANVLIDLVLDNRGADYPVDDFIYPVCFNMRHSIELRLKGAIEELIKIAKIKNKIIQFNLSGSHHIGNIWSFFKEESEKIDHRYIEINKALEPTILDVSDVDSTGQTFRYPVDIESQKHLTDVSIISFLQLKIKFNELEENLDNLHYLNNYLLEEYKVNTFTTKMSRVKLFYLANDLPDRTTWSSQEFKQVKLDLMDKYSLSSNDLTKSINLILNHYEMAPMIGKTIPLKSLSFDEICLLLDEWMKINSSIKNPPPENGVIEVIDFNDTDELTRRFKQIKERFTAKENMWEKMSSIVTPQILADFKALYYFARFKRFSENYISIYEYELKNASALFNKKDDFKISFFHLYDKADLINNFIISLLFLNQHDIVNRIMARYELDHVFKWFDEAKSRRLFMLPEICGYKIDQQ
ncbi:hypothetical protein [Aeromonas hydrophila]|uniref:hypothetical protein n=1 Tax=Aeromonas hydrophila TaxID=644 RepID=UPI001F6208AB|nr:hypothetical protein [Aeromonas hydrophila]UNU29088.1 hypothetical protein GCK65_08140 [Aeromonas hydrophila]